MEYIVYSDIWFDAASLEEGFHLRLAIPMTQITQGSIPAEHRPFLAAVVGLGPVRFDFFGFIKTKVIYQATGLNRDDPDQLPLPLVQLAAMPQTAIPSMFRQAAF